jgi:hypothetical protein
MSFSWNVGYLVGRAVRKCASLLGAGKTRQACPACGLDLPVFPAAGAFTLNEPFRCPSCKQWLGVSKAWSIKLRLIQLAVRCVIVVALFPLLFGRHFILFFVLATVLTFASIVVFNVLALVLLRPDLEPYLGFGERSLFDPRSWR